MQTAAEAAQAITSSVRRDCSVCLYFLIKNQIIINLKSDRGSLVALYVVNRGFGRGDEFGRSESKIDSLWELYLHQAGAL